MIVLAHIHDATCSLTTRLGAGPPLIAWQHWMPSEESPSADASPHSQAVSGEMAVDKSKRYDRGIRVWGAHGQEALEAAKVCLLNAGPTGTEALKNLVLGGIDSFTIVDGAKVAPADLGNNFLLTADGLGTSRALCATGALAARRHAACLALGIPADPLMLRPWQRCTGCSEGSCHTSWTGDQRRQLQPELVADPPVGLPLPCRVPPGAERQRAGQLRGRVARLAAGQQPRLLPPLHPRHRHPGLQHASRWQ